MVEAQRLPEPIFTPSTKAEAGAHDENISFEEAVGLIGKETAEKVRDISLQLYAFAAAHAEKTRYYHCRHKVRVRLLRREADIDRRGVYPGFVPFLAGLILFV